VPTAPHDRNEAITLGDLMADGHLQPVGKMAEAFQSSDEPCVVALKCNGPLVLLKRDCGFSLRALSAPLVAEMRLAPRSGVGVLTLNCENETNAALPWRIGLISLI
jgi:hypothetical protein